MKLSRSKKLYKQASRFIPSGVNSPVRAYGAVGGNPLFISHAKGSKIYDADNNSYIDYMMSWGALILGHSSPAVIKGIKKRIVNGTSYGAPTEKEGVFAEMICEAVASIEKVRLVNSGSEATMSAIRLARGYTGKDKIIKFEGCYHGSVDSLLVSAGSGGATFGIPDSLGVTASLVKDTIVCPYNDIDCFYRIVKRWHKKIAGCVIEPVCGNMGVVLPETKFLIKIREITGHYKIIFIFDEVITGFRFCFGGVQNLFKIQPDITCLGKIIGGGFPLAAYGGRREIMDKLAPAGEVYQAGTLSGNPIAVQAGISTLSNLQKLDYGELDKKTEYLCEQFRKVLRRGNIDFCLNRFGSMFTLFFTKEQVDNFSKAKGSDTKRFASYFWSMIKQGIYFSPSQFEANFLSFSHTSKDIQRTIAAFESFIQRLKK